MTTRASVISTANTAVEALPTSTRMNSRSGAGHDQPQLQIEPWRRDFRADRPRGGQQKFGDVIQVHGQISSQGRSAPSDQLDSNIPQVSITAAPAPSIQHANAGSLASKSGTLPLMREMGWRRTVATIRMRSQRLR